MEDNRFIKKKPVSQDKPANGSPAEDVNLSEANNEADNRADDGVNNEVDNGR